MGNLITCEHLLIGAIFKAPEVSREEIQINNEKVRAKREDLKEMHPRKFEFLVADVFQSLGYKATVTLDLMMVEKILFFEKEEKRSLWK